MSALALDGLSRNSNAYYYGALPASYSAVRTSGGFRWNDDSGAKLKIGSDAKGSGGAPVVKWAPAKTGYIKVSLDKIGAPARKGPIPTDPDALLDDLLRETGRCRRPL